MVPQLEIMLIAIFVASACVLPGVFLVLRGVAMMSDAISHSILLGIVVSFFIIKNLHSPLLIVGASLAGILTVTLTELLIQTRRLKKDAAIGLVFPVFFSIGVILISKYAGAVHLDTDAVLLGELAFAPFDRLTVSGIDIGPKALWVMAVIFAINSVVIGLFYKEFKLATFDAGLATALGFSPAVIHYVLMTLTSITAVGAFDAVGSILVVALMVTPPATAYLLTERLSYMLGLSVVLGILSAVLGYGLAHWLDASIAGSMATMTGILFVLTLCFAPDRGLIAKWMLARDRKLKFAGSMLLVQLLEHEGKQNEAWENTISNLIYHMGWAPSFAQKVTEKQVQSGHITRSGNLLRLTALGRELAKRALVEI